MQSAGDEEHARGGRVFDKFAAGFDLDVTGGLADRDAVHRPHISSVRSHITVQGSINQATSSSPHSDMASLTANEAGWRVTTRESATEIGGGRHRFAALDGAVTTVTRTDG